MPCIADARTSADYGTLLADAGLTTVHTESHDGALTTVIDQIEARLELQRMTAPAQLEAAGLDLPGRPLLHRTHPPGHRRPAPRMHPAHRRETSGRSALWDRLPARGVGRGWR